MKIISVVVNNTTQAKLILRHGTAVIKIPGKLPIDVQIEVRDKLIRLADINSDTKEFLKLFYKIGTPYFFLNRKLSFSKRETAFVYKYSEI